MLLFSLFFRYVLFACLFSKYLKAENVTIHSILKRNVQEYHEYFNTRYSKTKF